MPLSSDPSFQSLPLSWSLTGEGGEETARLSYTLLPSVCFFYRYRNFHSRNLLLIFTFEAYLGHVVLHWSRFLSLFLSWMNSIARWTQTNIHDLFFVSKVKRKKVDRPSTLSLYLPLKKFFSHIVIPSSLVLIEILSHPVFGLVFYTALFNPRPSLFPFFAQTKFADENPPQEDEDFLEDIHSKDRDRLKNEYLTPYMCNTLTHLLPIFLSLLWNDEEDSFEQITQRSSWAKNSSGMLCLSKWGKVSRPLYYLCLLLGSQLTSWLNYSPSGSVGQNKLSRVGKSFFSLSNFLSLTHLMLTLKQKTSGKNTISLLSFCFPCNSWQNCVILSSQVCLCSNLGAINGHFDGEKERAGKQGK